MLSVETGEKIASFLRACPEVAADDGRARKDREFIEKWLAVKAKTEGKDP